MTGGDTEELADGQKEDEGGEDGVVLWGKVVGGSQLEGDSEEGRSLGYGEELGEGGSEVQAVGDKGKGGKSKLGATSEPVPRHG